MWIGLFAALPRVAWFKDYRREEFSREKDISLNPMLSSCHLSTLFSTLNRNKPEIPAVNLRRAKRRSLQALGRNPSDDAISGRFVSPGCVLRYR